MLSVSSFDLDLPGGVGAQGQLASVRVLWALQNTAFPGRWLDEMAPGTERSVVVARLQRKTSFGPLQVGARLLDAAQARQEADTDSEAGAMLTELERREVRAVRQRLKGAEGR